VDDEKNYEVIIVDHKSTDSTLIIAREILSIANIKLIEIPCLASGKSPALVLGLNSASGDFVVIVDDDNILLSNYIFEAKKLVKESNIGCIGAIGIADSDLVLPPWFPIFSGVYAIGLQPAPKSTDSVWGAAALINKKAWDRLRLDGFSFELNPARESHSSPIAIGGEDGELSVAIKMIGFQVFYSDKLKFIHKFEQSRLTEQYLLMNTLGSTRAVPFIDIYRLFIHHKHSRIPYLIWNLIIFKRLMGCALRFIKFKITRNELLAKFHSVRARALFEGYFEARKAFNRVFSKLSIMMKVQASFNKENIC
jgi:glycosyltransferase involved in cell wall biosynthesis